MDNNSDSGANTILIVIVLLILVGFGAWWFSMRNTTPTPQNKDSKINVDVKLPITPALEPSPQ